MTSPARGIGPVACADALGRLHRVHGRLGGLIRMTEDGRDCAEVLTPLAAITHALQRAGFRIVADGLERGLTSPDGDGSSTEQLEKLLLSPG